MCQTIIPSYFANKKSLSKYEVWSFNFLLTKYCDNSNRYKCVLEYMSYTCCAIQSGQT